MFSPAETCLNFRRLHGKLPHRLLVDWDAWDAEKNASLIDALCVPATSMEFRVAVVPIRDLLVTGQSFIPVDETTYLALRLIEKHGEQNGVLYAGQMRIIS